MKYIDVREINEGSERYTITLSDDRGTRLIGFANLDALNTVRKVSEWQRTYPGETRLEPSAIWPYNECLMLLNCK